MKFDTKIVIDEHTVHPLQGAVVYQSSRQVPPIRDWISNVSLFIPVYYNGNVSLVIFRDSSRWYVPWSTPNLYRRGLKALMLDPQEVRRAYELELGRHQYAPFINPHNHTVYPALKVRNPHTRNDGAVGYFRLDDGEVIKPVAAMRSVLYTQFNFAFDILMSKQCAMNRRRDSHNFLVLSEYRHVNTWL
ncbi:hypothetical protein [Alicyclobacillus suci]|uniref:hypothetical protein n=1 Tax=Alicyclobacillus suci TaxID=2816080 RepID=UPI001A8E0BDB|nr:hypothetical protein [Alicyclobacillus suci]